MKAPALGNRLLSVADMVRQGACLADIGTDHAYLPLFLLERGIIESAVCSDVNEGPLKSAIRNVRERGFSDSIRFVLADGISEGDVSGVTDIAICGMGGELIADIISRAGFLKSRRGIRFILQPMTRQAYLRTCLAQSGFSVVEERYSFENEKYYLAFSVEYTGDARSISNFEAEFGSDFSKESFTPEKIGYFNAKRRALMRAAEGKIKSGISEPEELSLLRRLNTIESLSER